MKTKTKKTLAMLMSLVMIIACYVPLLGALGIEANAAAVLSGLLWPVPTSYSITKDRYFSSSHDGIDIEYCAKHNIVAAYDGKVVKYINKCQHISAYCQSCDENWFGVGLILEHTINGTKYYTHYAHMQYNSIPAKYSTVGATVKKGDVIGKVGSSGFSGGYHLHFAVYKNSAFGTAVCTTPTDSRHNYTSANGVSYTYSASTTKLYWPVPGHTTLSQGFHDGTSISIGDSSISGATVIAAIGGKVTHTFSCNKNHDGTFECSNNCNGFGTGLVIEGTDGRIYQYAHFQNGSIPSGIKIGSTVSDAQVIGKVGNTGYITGTALEFGISLGNYYTPSGIDPSKESYIYTEIEKKLTVNYNINGGYIDSTEYKAVDSIVYKSDGTKINQVWTYNKPQTYGLWDAATIGLKKDGYTFLGWGTKPTGSDGKVFDDKNTALLPTDINPNVANGNCSTTLYAVWQADHVCSYNYFVNYMAEHPHYAVYRCTCGETRVDYGLTSTFDNCTECNPNPYPVVNVIIKNPSVTTINYGDSITLHADFEGTLPEGAKIVWEPSNDNFSYEVSADGKAYKISPASSGDTTFTARVVDADGKLLAEPDTQTMTSKAGFFLKLIAFIKGIFGLTKDIPQVFKAVS